MPRINELIAVSKAGWLGLLAYLAFVGVTLIGVEDADFFIVERRTELPLIGVTIPTTLFFAIAPGLGVMLYAYLHLYLLKLWEALSEAPAQVNALPLGDVVRPWLIADYALSFRKDAPLRDRPLRGMANFVSGIFIFLAAPLVLAGFWWRSMPKHDEVLTVIFCGIPLSVAVYVGVASWLRLRRLARGDGSDLKWGRGGKRLWVGWTFVIALAGWFTTEGTLYEYARRLGIKKDGWWNVTPFPELLVPAQLAGVIFVETPPDWKDYNEAKETFRLDLCRAEGLTPTLCGPRNLDAFERSDLEAMRQTWCEKEFVDSIGKDDDLCARYFIRFEKTFEKRWVRDRENVLTNLQTRDLSNKDLRYANFTGAQLLGVNLDGTRLNGANFSGALMERADFSFSDVGSAKFGSAKLENASFFQADMQSVNLSFASLNGADLTQARMEEAILFGTSLVSTDLYGAQMQGAWFKSCTMDIMTNWENVELDGAAAESVDFSTTPIFSYQIQTIFADSSTLLSPSMTRPPHWPTLDLPSFGGLSFESQWRSWRSQRSLYSPTG